MWANPVAVKRLHTYEYTWMDGLVKEASLINCLGTSANSDRNENKESLVRGITKQSSGIHEVKKSIVGAAKLKFDHPIAA